jgi:hypothetical protein
MKHKEELEINIKLLEKNIESPIKQCFPHIAMLSRLATKTNYEAFMNNEINSEDLQSNNNKIGEITRRFIDTCSCMRE